ncbi:MAG TPA: hypothetical protein VG028_06940, partial [Terriglobia bacterium]|nr:hypothetical protein [Terriglobia bacterium]
MKNGAAEALPPERLREMFAAILADPEARKAMAQSFVACLPIQGGTACSSITSSGNATANSIAMFTTACNIESSVISQASGNVGIGTTPGYKLE